MFGFIIVDKIGEEKLVYIKSEYSFDTIPTVNSDGYILVDNLQIGFNMTTGYFTQLFGYFPQLLFCEKKDFLIPNAQKGILTLDIENSILSSGDSIRLKMSEEWVTLYSEKMNYVYFGKEVLSQCIEYIEFCSGCIAGIAKTGDLEGLWLPINWI
ncbi:TPA: hypothetical protein ACT2GM_001647 [Streptococcus suis]